MLWYAIPKYAVHIIVSVSSGWAFHFSDSESCGYSKACSTGCNFMKSGWIWKTIFVTAEKIRHQASKIQVNSTLKKVVRRTVKKKSSEWWNGCVWRAPGQFTPRTPSVDSHCRQCRRIFCAKPAHHGELILHNCFLFSYVRATDSARLLLIDF